MSINGSGVDDAGYDSRVTDDRLTVAVRENSSFVAEAANHDTPAQGAPPSLESILRASRRFLAPDHAPALPFSP